MDSLSLATNKLTMDDYSIYDLLLARLNEPIPRPPPPALDWTKITIPTPTKTLLINFEGETIDTIWQPIESWVRVLDQLNSTVKFTRRQYEEAWYKAVKISAGLVRESRICLEVVCVLQVSFSLLDCTSGFEKQLCFLTVLLWVWS